MLKQLSLQDHIELGEDLQDVRNKLLLISNFVSNYYGKNKKVSRSFLAALNELDKLKYVMDDYVYAECPRCDELNGIYYCDNAKVYIGENGALLMEHRDERLSNVLKREYGKILPKVDFAKRRKIKLTPDSHNFIAIELDKINKSVITLQEQLMKSYGARGRPTMFIETFGRKLAIASGRIREQFFDDFPGMECPYSSN